MRECRLLLRGLLAAWIISFQGAAYAAEHPSYADRATALHRAIDEAQHEGVSDVDLARRRPERGFVALDLRWPGEAYLLLTQALDALDTRNGIPLERARILTALAEAAVALAMGGITSYVRLGGPTAAKEEWKSRAERFLSETEDLLASLDPQPTKAILEARAVTISFEFSDDAADQDAAADAF